MTSRKGAGDRFQRETQYYRDREPDEPLSIARRPPLFKKYKGASTVTLKKPEMRGGGPLWEILVVRRSIRDYADMPLEQSELSQLLWASQGITEGAGLHGLRAAPSAGALYPVETYVAVHSVEGIEPGIYHYGMDKHQLEQIKAGDFRAELARAVLGQEIAEQAGAVFIWSAVFDRCKWGYGQRAYRYVYLDAGHIGQNLALAAASLGLGSCPIAAFFDSELNAIIGIDGERESVIYLTTVGSIRKQTGAYPIKGS